MSSKSAFSTLSGGTPPTLSDVMRPSRLKIQRAKRHIDEIIEHQNSLPHHLYHVGVQHRSVALLRRPDCDRLSYSPKDSISEHFGAIVGDCANNLRESLDYWINAAAACVGPKKKLQFPFSKKWEDLEAAKTFVPVQGSFPDAATFIKEKVKPCGDTNLDLWSITNLSNFNKHNGLIPNVTVATVRAESFAMGGVEVTDLRVTGDANGPLNLALSGYRSIAIKGDLEVAVDATFQKGGLFENEPVVPTLLRISDVVSQTLDALEIFIKPYCRT